jgi:uncharacterized membrane protein
MLQHPENGPKTSVTRRLFSLLLAGLATVIPIVGTAFLLTWIYKALLALGRGLVFGIVKILDWFRIGGSPQEDDPTWLSNLEQVPQAVWFLIPIVLLACMGLAVTNRPGQAVVNWIDRAITRVPFMGFLYATIKQGVDAFRDMGGSRKFKGVAYVDYPSPGCRLLGFITSSFHDAKTNRDLTSIFIPTSPNPMTGFVVIVEEDKIEISDLTVEEATKLLLSAGLVAPEKLKRERKIPADKD